MELLQYMVGDLHHNYGCIVVVIMTRFVSVTRHHVGGSIADERVDLLRHVNVCQTT